MHSCRAVTFLASVAKIRRSVFSVLYIDVLRNWCYKLPKSEGISYEAVGEGGSQRR